MDVSVKYIILLKYARLKMRNKGSQDLAQTVVLQELSMSLAVIIRSNSRMQHYHLFASFTKKVKNGAQCQPFLISEYLKHLQGHLHNWKMLPQDNKEHVLFQILDNRLNTAL